MGPRRVGLRASPSFGHRSLHPLPFAATVIDYTAKSKGKIRACLETLKMDLLLLLETNGLAKKKKKKKLKKTPAWRASVRGDKSSVFSGKGALQRGCVTSKESNIENRGLIKPPFVARSTEIYASFSCGMPISVWSKIDGWAILLHPAKNTSSGTLEFLRMLRD